MNYALIENGIVTNIIRLSPGNAADFPGSVPMLDRPVAIGDAYVEGVFKRNGETVLTKGEKLAQADEEIAVLDEALLNAEYENIIGGLES